MEDRCRVDFKDGCPGDPVYMCIFWRLGCGTSPHWEREVARYWLDIVGLTSTRRLHSGSQVLEGSLMLYPCVARGGELIIPQLSSSVLEFTRVKKICPYTFGSGTDLLEVSGRDTGQCTD